MPKSQLRGYYRVSMEDAIAANGVEIHSEDGNGEYVVEKVEGSTPTEILSNLVPALNAKLSDENDHTVKFIAAGESSGDSKDDSGSSSDATGSTGSDATT